MIDDSKEYIICSAIHYDDGRKHAFQSVYGVESGFVIGGFRHPYIMGILPSNPHHPECKEKGIKSTRQGFITSRGRFVDREEALTLAMECGQVTPGYGDQLYSEYVFPKQTFYATVPHDEEKKEDMPNKMFHFPTGEEIRDSVLQHIRRTDETIRQMMLNGETVYLAVSELGIEEAHIDCPERADDHGLFGGYWYGKERAFLEKGSIEKLIGEKPTWDNCPTAFARAGMTEDDLPEFISYKIFVKEEGK